MSSSSPQSLCLIRLSALGDICHTVALVRALQQGWPSTEITWIIGKKEVPLVQHLPNIRFIVYDKAHNWASFWRIRQALRHELFDVLVLAQTSFRANILSLAVRARRRVGFGHTHTREGHHWFINEPMDLPEHTHQAKALFAFAPYLLQDPSVSLATVDRGLPIIESARAFAEIHQSNAKEAVLISPCSSHRLRNWSIEGYAAVADWAIEHLQRPVILIGGPSALERQMGEAIEGAMQQPVVNLIGQDTLDQALAMLARAFCLISPDSGPAHMADGLGTPVIGLYAATRVGRSGPFASQPYCVDAFSRAAQQFKGKREDQLPWSSRIEVKGVMDLITPSDVIEKLRQLHERGRSETR